MFKYSRDHRTVQIGFQDGEELSLEQAQVVALVNIGDELEKLHKKVDALTALVADRGSPRL